MNTIEQLREPLPPYAKDTKLNLASVLTEEGAPGLTSKQIFSIALASAYAVKQTDVVQAIIGSAQEILNDQDIEAAKSAATIMAMNNVYYRFIHMASDKSYASMPAKLRMNVIGNPGVPKVDFELNCLAVSAINGCGMCIDAHVQELVKVGVTTLAVQSAVRIAAVINSAAMGVMCG